MLQHHCSRDHGDIRADTLVQANLGKGVRNVLFDAFPQAARHVHPPPPPRDPCRRTPNPQGEHIWVCPIDGGCGLVQQPQKPTTPGGGIRYQEPEMVLLHHYLTLQHSKTRKGTNGQTAPPFKRSATVTSAQTDVSPPKADLLPPETLVTIMYGGHYVLVTTWHDAQTHTWTVIGTGSPYPSTTTSPPHTTPQVSAATGPDRRSVGDT